VRYGKISTNFNLRRLLPPLRGPPSSRRKAFSYSTEGSKKHLQGLFSISGFELVLYFIVFISVLRSTVFVDTKDIANRYCIPEYAVFR